MEFAGCAIIVTHDRWFLNRVATSILAFRRQRQDHALCRQLRRLPRGQASHREGLVAPAAGLGAAPASKESKEKEREKVPAPRAKPLSYAERIELDGILEAIEKADAAVIAAEAKLADPSLYTGRNGEVGRMQAALDHARAEAARLTARWEELETKRDASTRT